jgi:tetratricopeptide (TPR) repeat protein
MEEIHRYEGSINQFRGDGVMALFGAPVAHEDHAQRACYAALGIKRASGPYADGLKKEYGINFKMRIGLNSGSVVVGSIGDDLRMDYTADGDTTNLAARMESLARPGSILLSGHTCRLVRDFFEFESLGKVKVKGKRKPQEAFELLEPTGVATRIGASVAKGLTQFVGRKSSTAALMKAFGKAQSGAGQVVGIVGEAGIGKSRLLLELRNQLPQGEYNYLEGRCVHYGGSTAYLPILDVLRSYFEIKDGDREPAIKKIVAEKIIDLGDMLKSAIPPLQELLSLKVDNEGFVELEPKEKRERIFEALRNLIIRMSQKKALVFSVEDLQWIDKTSEEFLSYLIDWLTNAPILLILLYRPEYVHPWGSKSYYSQVGLGQLSTKTTAELVQSILEGGQVMPKLGQLIISRAGGNPLFVEEITRSLLENGSIKKADDRFTLNGKASELEVPDNIQGIIASRIDRLEGSLKQIIQVASVMGREFSFRIIQSIMGASEELKSHFLKLQGLEFIYEKSLFPELEYFFKHALTQEVAYNSLLLKRRREIHEKIGGAIEGLYPMRLEEFHEVLAYHYSKSDNSEKACRYQILSGNKATNNYSNWEAFHSYKRAIDILKKIDESDENKRRQVEVYLLMATCMIALSYPEGSFQMLREGERLTKELGDEKSHATFCSRMGNYCTFRGKHLEGIRYAEDAFDEARRTQDIELLARVAINLCFSYLATGDYHKITDAALGVLDRIEKRKRESDFLSSRPVNLYSVLCAFCGNAMGHLGFFDEGEVFLEKGMHAAAEDDLRSLGFCEWHYGHFLNVRGEWRLAVSHFQKCIDYLEEAKWFVLSGLALAGLGLGYQHLGDHETAMKEIEKSISVEKENGIEGWLSTHYWYLSLTHFALSDLRNAGDFAAQALKLSQRNEEKHIEGATTILLGRIWGKTELLQTEKAERYILQGIRILDELRIKPWSTQGYLFLGELYGDANQKEKAMEKLKMAEELFKEMGMDYWSAKTRELLERL